MSNRSLYFALGCSLVAVGLSFALVLGGVASPYLEYLLAGSCVFVAISVLVAPHV